MTVEFHRGFSSVDETTCFGVEFIVSAIGPSYVGHAPRNSPM
jgi:hypothetical protein